MQRRTRFLMALVWAVAPGCYNSQWGEQKAAQKRNAVTAAPAALRANEREGEGTPSPHAASSRAVRLRVRAFVTRSFTAQVVDAPRHLRDLFEDVNPITERDLGVHLELVETRTWDANDDDIKQAFEALRAADAGDGVDWVAGFIGSLPRATRSFHEVGRGSLVGKHVILRAPSSAERHDSIEKSFDELPEAQRRELEKRLRRHRAAAVFLHELGHTLGSGHEPTAQSIMFHEYNAKMSAFGPSAIDVMRAGLVKRGSSDGASAPAPAPVTAPAPAPTVQAAESVVPETPELAGADRERFAEAYRESSRGDVVAAWNVAKPLFGAYPESMSVQDLRCQLASRSMRFELARRECASLMRLSTQAPH